MVDLTELDGVGPARSESLEEAGYSDFETLADADPEALAEDAGVTEDKALDFIVQSQNLVAEQEAEVEESKPVTEEVADAVEESEDEEVGAEEAVEELPDSDELEEEIEEAADDSDTTDETDESVDESPENEGPQEIQFELTFDEALEYDTFFDSVMGQRATMLRSNRDGVEAFDHVLDQMRASSGVGATVELELTESQLNDLHNSVRGTMIDYKGDNLIDHMDALQEVLNDVNEVRDKHLF